MGCVGRSDGRKLMKKQKELTKALLLLQRVDVAMVSYVVVPLSRCRMSCYGGVALVSKISFYKIRLVLYTN